MRISIATNKIKKKPMVSRLWYSTLLQTNVSKEYTINIEKATVHMELLSWKKKTFQEKDLINSNQQIYFLLTEKKNLSVTFHLEWLLDLGLGVENVKINWWLILRRLSSRLLLENVLNTTTNNNNKIINCSITQWKNYSL